MRLLSVLFLLVLVALLVACAPQGQPLLTAAEPTAPAQPAAPQTLILMSHDSFAASEEVIRQFEADANARLEFLKVGDAGEALNKAASAAVLVASAPVWSSTTQLNSCSNSCAMLCLLCAGRISALSKKRKVRSR